MKSIDEIREIAHSWSGPKSICKCTHTGDGIPSEHADIHTGAPGHGPCHVKGCSCIHFTWDHWMPEFERATS